MGTLTITTNGSFGFKQKTFSAMKNGHADAVAQAIEWLASEALPTSTALDHDLHEDGCKPNEGFRRKRLREELANIQSLDKK